MKFELRSLALAGVAAVALTGTAAAQDTRDTIRIVGSSTVFPFSTAVAEQFGQTSDFPTPVVESTGSGGGLKLFCAGVGVEHPDMTNASRRIKQSEIDRCAGNGVTGITEVKVGFDGIVLGNSRRSDRMNIDIPSLWLALAAGVPDENGNIVGNPYIMWNEIDPQLPAAAIRVMGPPPTSGTRDAFVELVMEEGCKHFDAVTAIEESDEDRYEAICASIREDGAFVEAGENDNLIVQKLEADPDAFGIFGFSFLDQNRDRIQGSMIAGVAPTFDNIAAGDYPVSRSLYFYVKNAHIGAVPGIREYVTAFTSEDAWGPFGYLADKGLIPLPDADRAAMAESARSAMPLAGL
ncbi:MAG: substrate-binding domain-containing protein [Rhodospirillales bacterium]|nr:substrate-binding domain-containing protein [Rhodospirillales bacterium]